MPLAATSRTGRLGAMLAAAGCAVALAACGSAGGSATTAASKTGNNLGLQFSECMRSHGVPNFPDPSGSGGGIQITPSDGVNPQSPSFQSAQKACGKLLPGGGPAGGHPTEQAKLLMLHTAECMRRQGIPNFPDPTTHPPSPGSASGGGATAVIGRGGEFLVLPSNLSISSPAFQRAAAACHFPLPGKARSIASAG